MLWLIFIKSEPLECLLHHILNFDCFYDLSQKGPKQPNRSNPEGSWTCKKCGNLNYPFRSICNRRACRSEKTASAS